MSKTFLSVEEVVGRVPAVGLYTVAVYVCAVYFSPWLAGRYLALVMHLVGGRAIPPGDWYLQHLEVISILPALLAGYASARRTDSTATWAWVVPTLALVFQMLRYRGALIGSTNVIAYFFDVQTTMPTLANLSVVDPIRTSKQMFVTAPFYAGAAFSIGGWAAKRRLAKKLYTEGVTPR